MNVLDLYGQRGLNAQKAGKEYHGPCPGCGGEDRFVIFPDQNGGDGSWWCRRCNAGGDNIQFLMEFDGKSFPEAAQAVGRELADLPPRSMSDVGRTPSRPVFEPIDNRPPEERWQARALKFVDACCAALLADDQRMAWLLEKRGLTEKTVRRHRIGWHVGENARARATFRPRESWGLSIERKENGKKKMLWLPEGMVIPRMDGEMVTSIRLRRPADALGDRDRTRYYVVPGSSSRQLLLGRGRRAYVVVEAELDGYLLFQELDAFGVGVVALGSSATKPDANAWRYLRRAVCVLNALDYDAAGAKASKWWSENLRRVRRWPVPMDKDPGDAHKHGVDLVAWAVAGLAPLWRVGCSLVGAVERGGDAAVLKNDTSADDVGTKTPDYPQSVLRLGEIMACGKVGIEHTDAGMRVVRNEAWERDNPALSREFAMLAMRDADCQAFIDNHPDERITGDNFWEVER